MNKTPTQMPRPWYRLHKSTILAAALTLAGLVLIVVPGEWMYFTKYSRSGPLEFIKDLPIWTDDFAHGWPWVYLERMIHDGPTIGIPPDRLPCLVAGSWPGTGSIRGFDRGALALDLLTSTLILAIATASCEVWRRRRQRVWQFHLFDLAVVTLLIAAGLGYWRSCHIRYAVDRATADIAPSSGLHLNWEYCGPLWLRRLVGLHYLPPELHSVTGLSYSDPLKPADRKRIGSSLQSLQNLRKLEVFCPTGNDLNFLAGTSIEVVEMQQVGAEFTDSAIAALASLPRLRELSISGPAVTDAGIAHLARCQRLERLEINSGTDVTADGVSRLRKQLPMCAILWHDE